MLATRDVAKVRRMNLTLNHPDIEPFEPATDVNALVAYEDFAGGTRAKSLLESVGRSCGAEGQLIYSMWKFDVLAVPRLMQMAAEEAAAADIIIIAAHEREALPDAVLDWINLWRGSRTHRPRALVAIVEPDDRDWDEHDENETEPESDAGKDPYERGQIYSYLEMVARLDNMDFFAAGVEARPDIELKLRKTVPAGVSREGGATGFHGTGAVSPPVAFDHPGDLGGATPQPQTFSPINGCAR